MSFWEYIWAWSSTTKLLLHFNWNILDSSWNWNNWSWSLTYTTSKVWNYSANFNWTSDYITISADAFQSMTSWTLWLWFYANTSNTLKNIIRFDKKFILQMWVTANLTYYMVDSWWTLRAIYNVNSTYTSWKWYHMLMTQWWTNTKCYLNWAYIWWSTSYSTYTWAKTNQYIWRESVWYYHNWKTDEIIIENREWTAEEIKKYYTSSVWRFWIL